MLEGQTGSLRRAFTTMERLFLCFVELKPTALLVLFFAQLYHYPLLLFPSALADQLSFLQYSRFV
jgi:hypothetical protein